MTEQEIAARIRRIERILGIEDVPGVRPQDIKAYREQTGCSFQVANDVVTRHQIASLFIEEVRNA